MDRSVKGITYTTYIDPSQVNSNNCVLTNSSGSKTTTKNYRSSSIKEKTRLEKYSTASCRKECENVSGTTFNLTLTPKN